MSHRRLRTKATGYADYARVEAWRERHDFCPALLFGTIARRRALAFLAALERELDDSSELLACACGLARDPGRAVSEPAWRLGTDEPADLVEALREARRPYDAEQARCERRRRREAAERERLRRDPVAFRLHLRRQARGIPERLGEPTRTALLIEDEAELAKPELKALAVVWAMLTDPLTARWADREPDREELKTLTRLADRYRSRQLEAIAELSGELGDGPALRRARARIEAGELLSRDELRWARSGAERDREVRAKQEELRASYLERREREARALAKAQGLAARLRRRPADFLAEVDRRLLRVCPRCSEIAYPGADAATAWSRADEAARLCPFCEAGGLEAWGERGELATARRTR